MDSEVRSAATFRELCQQHKTNVHLSPKHELSVLPLAESFSTASDRQSDVLVLSSQLKSSTVNIEILRALCIWQAKWTALLKRKFVKDHPPRNLSTKSHCCSSKDTHYLVSKILSAAKKLSSSPFQLYMRLFPVLTLCT